MIRGISDLQSHSQSPPIVIRVDADPSMGMGHLMRCLAIADAWEDFGERSIIVSSSSRSPWNGLPRKGLEQVLIGEAPGSVEDARQIARIALQHGARWVVVDGYHFGSEYQKELKDAGLSVLSIDDYAHADYYHSDIVLNQNIYASERMYPNKAPWTKLLLGTKYALLRREFTDAAYGRYPSPRLPGKALPVRVLVTMGGSDSNNITLKVLQALKQAHAGGLSLEAVIVTGRMNQYRCELEAASRDSDLPVRFEADVSNMADLIEWADIAISGAGITSLELAYMCTPALLIALADNQRMVAEGMAGAGLAVNLGWHQDLSPETIERALEGIIRGGTGIAMGLGRELIDGKGALRALSCIDDKIFALRVAGESDSRQIWEWRNDPETVRNSFTPRQVPWEQHKMWFTSGLPGRLIYIAETLDGIPIGQIRFDIDGGNALTSITVDRRFRGMGYGSRMIRYASRRLLRTSDVGEVHAHIKRENLISVQAFRRAGFSPYQKKVINGHEAIDMVLRRSV